MTNNKLYSRLKQRALKGDIKSILMLGRCHEQGLKGINVDLTAAFNWYAKAAERGNSLAQKKLGEMYFYGIGVPSNIKLAKEWKEKAKADNETAEAIKDDENKYGNILKVDFKKKKIIFSDEQKAELGDNNALFRLGIEQFAPLEGKAPNHKKSFSYFLKAAENGHIPSQFQIAYMYETGIGVEIDENEAFKWYEKAAKKGDMDSSHNLGLMYQDGRGTKQNYTLAYKWYKEAAKKGCELSCNKIGVLYFFGYGIPKNYERSFSWYMKAALKGYKYAEYNLGYSYFHGYGTKQDYKEAFKWFMRSAGKDHIVSSEYVAKMLGFGIGVKENVDDALKWAKKAFDAGSGSAAFCLGQIYQKKKNDMQNAVFYFKEGEKRNDANSIFALASIYLYGDDNFLHQPNYDKSLKYFKRMTELKENYAFEEIGNIYYSLKQYKLAYINYQKAYELTGVDGLKGIADLYYYGHFLKKDIIKALELYIEYYHQNGYKIYSTIKIIGDIYYYDLNIPKKAFYWYLKGLRFETSNYGFLKHAHYHVMKTYIENRKFDKVIKFAEDRIYLKNSDNCLFLLANAYFAKKDLPNAFKCYLKVNAIQTYLRMNAKALISFMAKNGQGIKKSDALSEKEEKYIVIEASTYTKYKIGHNFMCGEDAHPISQKYAKMWLFFAFCEGSYDAVIDLIKINIEQKNIIEAVAYMTFLKTGDKKLFPKFRLIKSDKALLKQKIKQLAQQKSMAKKLGKIQKSGIIETLAKKLESANYTVFKNTKISKINVDILAVNHEKIIPINIFDYNPIVKEDLVKIENSEIFIKDKTYVSPFNKLDTVADFLEKNTNLSSTPILLSVKNMVFEQTSLINKRKRTVLRSLGEIHQDISFEKIIPANKNTIEYLKKLSKNDIITKIKSLFKNLKDKK